MGDVPVERICPRCSGTHAVKNGHRQGLQQYRCKSGECGFQFADRTEAPGRRFPAEVIATDLKKTCPRCHETHVVNNGRRQGRQQYGCRSIRCGYQFADRAEAPGHRFPAEAIATAIELHLLGRPYREIAATLERDFSISDTKISGRTIYSWVRKYVNIAGEEGRKLPVRTVGPWRVEYASLHPVKGGCWIVQDLATSHVLAAQAGDSFDPAVAAELIRIFEASIGNLSDNLHFLTFGIDVDLGSVEDFQDVQEAIKRLFPFGDYIPYKDILVISRPYGIFSPLSDFWYPLQIMRKPKAFRSPESRQLLLDGWVAMHNIFDMEDDPDGPVPAELAGPEAPFRSWLDVVNYRVKAQEEMTGWEWE